MVRGAKHSDPLSPPTMQLYWCIVFTFRFKQTASLAAKIDRLTYLLILQFNPCGLTTIQDAKIISIKIHLQELQFTN